MDNPMKTTITNRSFITLAFAALLAGLFAAAPLQAADGTNKDDLAKRPGNAIFASLNDASFAELFKRFQSDVREKLRLSNRNRETLGYTGPILIGRDEWLFGGEELSHIEADENAYLASVDAIVDLHKQLKSIGVELIYAPFPMAWAVYPDKLSDVVKPDPQGRIPRMDYLGAKRFERLRAEGVTVVDLTPSFLKKRFGQHGVVIWKHDTHISYAGAVVAAQEIAEVLRTRSWYKKAAKVKEDKVEWRPTPSWHEWFPCGDLRGHMEGAPQRGFKAQANDTELRMIKGWAMQKVDRREIPGWKPIPYSHSPSVREWVFQTDAGKSKERTETPVLVMGDSNIGHERTGFPINLAYELKMKLAELEITGDGVFATREELARIYIKDPAYIKGKKAVVWVHSGRFTKMNDWFKNKGPCRQWQRIPVVNDMADVARTEPAQKKAPPEAAGALTITAKIVAVSKPPVPRAEPYANAVTTTLYDIVAIQKGSYGAKQVLALESVMDNYKLLPSASYKVGETHRLVLVPLGERSAKIKEAMRVDDTGVYTVDQFWADSVTRLR